MVADKKRRRINKGESREQDLLALLIVSSLSSFPSVYHVTNNHHCHSQNSKKKKNRKRKKKESPHSIEIFEERLSLTLRYVKNEKEKKKKSNNEIIALRVFVFRVCERSNYY